MAKDGKTHKAVSLPSLGTDEAMQLERRSRDRRNTTQQKWTTCGGSM